MKKYIIISLFLSMFLGVSFAHDIDPISIARDNGIQNCDTLITKTFSYFGDYKGYENNLETKFSSSPNNQARTVRFYFNLGFDRNDFILGDVVIVSAEHYCASYTNMSIIEENASCDQLKNTGDWSEKTAKNGFSWLSSGGVNALYISYNDNRSCKVNFFMSDVEFG